jgi:hypothetical protein
MARRRIWWICINPVPLVILLGSLLVMIARFLR